LVRWFGGLFVGWFGGGLLVGSVGELLLMVACVVLLAQVTLSFFFLI